MTTLCQITMNAGKDIPGSVIQYNLLKNSKRFDRIIVVDGNLTEYAKLFYTQFRNLEVINSPWEDSYVKQYEAWKSKLKDGEWALYLDCDEVPSEYLLNACDYTNVLENDIIRVPCVLHITEDGKKYYPTEEDPKREYTGQWTKNILIQNSNKIYFRHFGSHVISEVKGGYGYTIAPYYHMKSLESFVYNDVWQAFLHPEGQQYTPIEAAQFKAFTKLFNTTLDFKAATKKGKWGPPLVKFAWDNRWEVGRPISRLAWTYFLLEGHSMPRFDESFTWDAVKGYILGEEAMNLFQKNKEQDNYIDVSDLQSLL